MKVHLKTETYGEEMRQSIEISIDGEEVLSVHDGEPEDNNLCRNFNDCWNIVGMMKMAHEAGQRGEPFEYTKTSEEDNADEE